MKHFVLLCFLLWAPCVLGSVTPRRRGTSNLGTTLVRRSRFERYIDKVFADADSNKDGQINFTEVYELVLKIYVNLNRQAPVKPPTRETVMLVYEKSDKNHDNFLTRDEFEVLVKTVSKRAFVRVGSVKVVKIIGAPLLAEYLVRTLAGKEWLSKVATTLVPARFHEKVLPVISSRAFCRNVLIVLLVISLGNIVLGIVDFFLEMRFAAQEKQKRDTI